MQVDGCDRVYAIADEDLQRSDGERTSTVHFMRFELGRDMVAALQKGAQLFAGIDHANMLIEGEVVPPAVHQSLLADLAPVTTH